MAQHGPHHLPATSACLPDYMCVASLAVLQSCAEHKARGDLALLSSIHSVLLKSCSDLLPLARRLALQGVPALAACSAMEIQSNCVAVAPLTTLISGVEDEQCSAVSDLSMSRAVTTMELLPSQVCSDGDHKTSYLDYAQTILVPVLPPPTNQTGLPGHPHLPGQGHPVPAPHKLPLLLHPCPGVPSPGVQDCLL